MTILIRQLQEPIDSALAFSEHPQAERTRERKPTAIITCRSTVFPLSTNQSVLPQRKWFSKINKTRKWGGLPFQHQEFGAFQPQPTVQSQKWGIRRVWKCIIWYRGNNVKWLLGQANFWSQNCWRNLEHLHAVSRCFSFEALWELFSSVWSLLGVISYVAENQSKFHEFGASLLNANRRRKALTFASLCAT